MTTDTIFGQGKAIEFELCVRMDLQTSLWDYFNNIVKSLI